MLKTKSIILVAVAWLTGLLALAQGVSAQNLNNFTVDSFKVDYYLSKNEKNVAQLKVVENITTTFPNFDQNHGIERALPIKYKNKKLNVHVESVKQADGTEWQYSTSTKNNNQVLRIGNPDRYVQGSQQYIITYTVEDVITFYNDHDELYWDVNGDQWKQQLSEVSATLHISKELSEQISREPKCFTGSYGQSGSDCQISRSKDSSGEAVVELTVTRPFQASENASFVLGFEPNTFEKYQISPVIIASTAAAAFACSVLLPLGIGVFMWKRWKHGGKDPEGRGTIVAQYAAPKELNPILADVILNERMQTKAISATLIGLCIKGYVKLYEVEKKKLLGGSSEEYEVELLKAPSDLQAEEQKVIMMIFSGDTVGSKVNLSTLQNKLYKEASELTKMVYESVVTEQYFVTNPDKARLSYLGWGIGLITLGAVTSFIFIPFTLVFLGLIISGMIVLITSSVMPKRTQKGVDMKEHLLGMGLYMRLAESERIKFLQAPDTAEKIDISDNTQLIKLYEKLLPYAMLFGIEKDWAKQFANLYGEGQSPAWYSGHNAFSPVLFASAMSGFNSAATTSFSSPTSSGSSGYSGGGGFSGGGGGGGGGGGW